MLRKHHILSYLDTKKASLKKIVTFMRGYNLFKKEKKIYLFRKLKSDLLASNHKFDLFFLKLVTYFYKDFNAIDLNLSLSQYVIQRISTRKLNLNILMHKVLKKDIFFRLPTLYRKIINKNYNYNVSPLSSLLLWPLFCLLHWFYANYLMSKIFFKSLRNLNKKKQHSDLYFFQILDSNTPHTVNHETARNSYDLISWFEKFYTKQNIIVNKIEHDNVLIPGKLTKTLNINYSDHPYFFIKNISSAFKFLLVSFFLSFSSFVLLLTGRWSAAFLLSEIFKAMAFLDTNKSKNSKRFLFHYSETFYRPIWTYFSNLKNAETILYFYSTYDAPTDYINKNIDRSYEFANISWNKILVWDEHQKNILSPFVDKNCELIVVGPIWFRDKSFVFKKNSFKLLIFDMEVQRSSLHFGWGEISEYNNHNKKLSYLFLNDIYNLFKNNDIEIILKRKRQIGDKVQTSYKNLILKLKKDSKFTVIDEDVSPQYLMENVNVVITTPFTSANLYYSKNNLQNIYYDPIGYVNTNDPATRHIPLISGVNELEKWKKKINFNL